MRTLKAVHGGVASFRALVFFFIFFERMVGGGTFCGGEGGNKVDNRDDAVVGSTTNYLDSNAMLKSK